MRIGIDSYAYHRLLGQVRPGETAPAAPFERHTLSLLDEARQLGVELVSLETMFLGPRQQLDADELRAAAGPVELSLSWGDMHGLEFGANSAAAEDLLAWLDFAPALGCRMVRIVAASPKFRGAEPIEVQLARTAPRLRDACRVARANNVTLALENHGDLNATEMLQLLDLVDDPVLGVCLDTVNAPRVGDEPVAAARALASVTRMLHLKDSAMEAADPVAGPLSVPYGHGVIPLEGILGELEAHGFDGPVCVELGQLAPDADERTLVRGCVDWLRAHQDRAVRQ